MCWLKQESIHALEHVSVAGCLGYDVLGSENRRRGKTCRVSVAGCLGYDVLEINLK